LKVEKVRIPKSRIKIKFGKSTFTKNDDLLFSDCMVSKMTFSFIFYLS